MSTGCAGSCVGERGCSEGVTDERNLGTEEVRRARGEEGCSCIAVVDFTHGSRASKISNQIHKVASHAARQALNDRV